MANVSIPGTGARVEPDSSGSNQTQQGTLAKILRKSVRDTETVDKKLQTTTGVHLCQRLGKDLLLKDLLKNGDRKREGGETTRSLSSLTKPCLPKSYMSTYPQCLERGSLWKLSSQTELIGVGL